MEDNDDLKLGALLQEWQLPGAPKSLDERVLAVRRPWWRFLLTGSVRIPVPAGLALAAALLIMAGALWRQKPATAPIASSVSLVDFQPASDLNVRVIRQHESN